MTWQRTPRHRPSRVLLRYPRLGLAVANLTARGRLLLKPTGGRSWTTAPHQWQDLVGPLDPRDARRFCLEQAGGLGMNSFLWSLLKYGDSVRSVGIVRWFHEDRIQKLRQEGRPQILACWHAGPRLGFPLALRALGHPLTLIVHRESGLNRPSGWDVVETDGERDSGVAVFRRCLSTLRGGGIVAMACDVYTDAAEGVPVPILGRELRLRRGFAALSRATGAAILPVNVHWEGWDGLRAEVQAPLRSTTEDRADPELYERNVVLELAERLNAALRERPFDMEPRRVETILRASRLHADAERIPEPAGAGKAATPRRAAARRQQRIPGTS